MKNKILKINGDKFEVIYSGQEFTMCDIVDECGVPKEIYERCYIDDIGIRE